MINAYNKLYLEKARVTLGKMFDYAVNDLAFNLKDFWSLFITSPVSKQFESGDVSIICGRSGVELVLMVIGQEECYVKPIFKEERTKEYWLGWALAYYQWKTSQSFSQLTSLVSIEEILSLYAPYHEMDIRQFYDRVSEVYNSRKQHTSLKLRRLVSGISQLKLAEISGIPLRTIQQYEQGQKSINKASAIYLISLSKALYCNPQSLLETEEFDVL